MTMTVAETVAELGDGGVPTQRIACEVVIPVRWEDPPTEQVDDFRRYLARLVRCCEVTVVDGSTDPTAVHRWSSWPSDVRILRPDPRWAGDNGKVVGSMTGIQAARHERVVIADDDVRHTQDTLQSLTVALEDAELVLPQNYPTTWTWWSWWECGRVLLNRAVAADWPGTAAVRRSTALRMGGWCPDVLFENLEMARTVKAVGGRVVHRPDLLVARHPPSVEHFLAQRLRQAYEDQAVPARMMTQLGILPVPFLLRRHPLALAATTLAVVGIAESGRRRDRGAVYFHPTASLAAPLWMLERGVLSWGALFQRARGGLPYHGRRIAVPAHSIGYLIERVASGPRVDACEPARGGLS